MPCHAGEALRGEVGEVRPGAAVGWGWDARGAAKPPGRRGKRRRREREAKYETISKQDMFAYLVRFILACYLPPPPATYDASITPSFIRAYFIPCCLPSEAATTVPRQPPHGVRVSASRAAKVACSSCRRRLPTCRMPLPPTTWLASFS